MVDRVPYCGTIPAKLEAKDYSLFDAIKNTFDQQKLVCIFPEGGTGRSSELRRFRLGISRILYKYYIESRISIPVYPIGITGTRPYFHPYMQVGFNVGSPLYIHDYLQSKDYQTYHSFTEVLRNAVAKLIQQN
jgi:1-acyl-sn-glycerol-3-phosphate acyltransferase